MNKLRSIWKAEVRDYELDFQRIVNNANYFHYLDHARALHLHEIGINVDELAKIGTNIVLLSTSLHFKKPLKFGDSFFVESVLSRISKLKFKFDQHIFNEKNKELILEATSVICCFDSKTGKPCFVGQLGEIEINGE